MQNLKILNAKETKHILEKLEEQFGFSANKEDLDYIFLINKDNRIYILSKSIGNIDFESLKMDTSGLYFGELYKESIRLSIEGAQIIGPYAKKNIVFLDTDQMIEWIKGNELPFEDCGKSFVIVKHIDDKTRREDVLGCGKFKDGKLQNYVSKSRRLVVVNA